MTTKKWQVIVVLVLSMVFFLASLLFHFRGEKPSREEEVGKVKSYKNYRKIFFIISVLFLFLGLVLALNRKYAKKKDGKRPSISSRDLIISITIVILTFTMFWGVEKWGYSLSLMIASLMLTWSIVDN